MEICVYAICKNEAKFAARWMNSMSEADGIYVLDTGSTDDTPHRLRELGAHVTIEEIHPWRFDVARNRSLELVPETADICVSTDLDECFAPGWRAALEAQWKQGSGRAKYRYTWSFLPNGQEGCVFWTEKIHSRHGYRWVNPVHEVLQWQGGGAEPALCDVEGIQLNHYPDAMKSRGQYLPLLEIAVSEAPNNDRNVHYLGREYFFYRRWGDCIKTLERHLTLPTACWADERCASMRYLARAYRALGKEDAAQSWFLRAIAEAPHLREPWLDFAKYAYEKEEWELVLWLTKRALQIQERPRTYITEAESWGSLPYDLASLGSYYLGQYEKALAFCERALELDGENPRLQSNLQWIKRKLQ